LEISWEETMPYSIVATDQRLESIPIRQTRATAQAAVLLANRLAERGCIALIADPRGQTFTRDQFSRLLAEGKRLDSQRMFP
jgi:hypothetical protein